MIRRRSYDTIFIIIPLNGGHVLRHRIILLQGIRSITKED